jgi:hypothetical protein
MSRREQGDYRNRLLGALPADLFALLAGHLEPVELPFRHVLTTAHISPDFVVFIESGLGSVVGAEGSSAAHLFLGTLTTPNQTFMQVAGYGSSIPAEIVLALAADSAPLRNSFLRYIHSCEIQVAHSAVANARYNMNERLARWLLMCHDRMDGNDLPLTHEFLSLMLGVRRSGVTNEIHVLEGLKAIRATRGNIRVIDRALLEEIAGGSYGVAEAEYERLIGVPIRRRPA